MDHRSFRKVSSTGEVREAEKGVIEDKERRWWVLSSAHAEEKNSAPQDEKLAESIESSVTKLQKAQTARIRQMSISMRLYGNFSVFGNQSAAYARALMSSAAVKDRITYNAIQSIVDTVQSKIGEDKPRPYFLTSGGDYRQQRKAKKLNQWVEGTFYEQKTYEKGNDASRDAEISGDGIVFVYPQNGKVCHERVSAAEIWVDEEEAQYGSPRNLHRVKVVDRDVVAATWPEHAEKIWKAPKAKAPGGNESASDMVTICESWHLPVMDDKGDLVGGVRAVTLPAERVVLEQDEWRLPFFPFARISWCPRPLGYWSQGLAEQLQGEQLELNKELWLIQRSMQLAGTIKVLLPTGSKVAKEAISNEIGAIINYAGNQKPEFFCPEPIAPVYFENVNRIIERMYQKAGVSELSASGKKPAGLNSGAAQREFEDIQSDRFRTWQRRNQNFYVEIALISVAVASEMKKVKPVRVPSRAAFSTIDWKKDIGRVSTDEFVLQAFPVSKLPRDPAGRLAMIQELVQAGMISPRRGRKLLDYPDVDAENSLAFAQQEIIEKVLDAIVEDGDYSPPEPTDDLREAKEMCIEYIQRYRLLGLEDDRLDMLRNWNVQVDELLARTLAPPTAAPPMQGAAQAPPVPPQPSDLVQNTPQPLAA